MSKSLSKDMTKGSEAGHIVRFALPLLAGNILQQLYNIADTIIVGKYLGDDAIAAVGATGSVTFLFYTLCLGLAIGAGVIISQYFGAGQLKMVKSAIFNSGIVTAFFGILVSIISIFLTMPVLDFLKTPDNLIEASSGYMKITCGGTIAVAAYNWINSVMRSLGDSKTPLIFLGFASIMNVLLDLLFVVYFQWGINGAAIATIIAQGCSALASIIYAFKKNNDIKLIAENRIFDRVMALKCIKTGVPIALQNGMVAVSMAALQRVTNSFGDNIMAAYTVSMRIEQFIQQPFSSLNVSVATFTGQNTGAAENQRVIKGYKVGMRIAAVIALVVMVVFIIFGRIIVGCFVSGDYVISIGTQALQITSLFYIFLGTIHVTRGFLNGAGDTNYAMINGITEVICRILFSLILTQIAFIGYYGIWWTTCITWFATALISVLRYKQGNWKRKRVF